MTQRRARNDDPRWIAYRGPRPADARREIVLADVLPEDSRLWVPIGDRVWSRPLSFVPTQGYWVHLLRVARTGVFNRHRHASPVHGYVLKGRWHYLEHEWEAAEGSYVFEPPGDTHTLVVPEGVDEMITLFHTTGTILYVDPDGAVTGYEDVLTRIEACRRHFIEVGLGADFVDSFIR
ncbi:MAG TPA: 2,4'-dihydroxyacetophenone dioxygenase family protein [Steroidobacteraceae bacterium]|jgi:quercetin dioxygenase-like cupin family protein|nr:2,4'-dihydroxyacetophenone dioxygenase family protein [Steroidobacteraceae bacterium]